MGSSEVIRALDDLALALTPAGSRDSPELPRVDDPPPPPAPKVHRAVSSPPIDGTYLEERLLSARNAIAGLRQESEEISARSGTMLRSVKLLGSEVERAASELAYVRSQGVLGRATPSDFARDATVRQIPSDEPPFRRRTVSRCSSQRSTPAEPGSDPGRYRAFTVERYNRTMGSVKGRRRSVAAGVLLLAAVISAALVTIAFLSHEAEPSLWLAILPGVWMIPVPFFVLSFRGTQRVLRRNHFDLPEAA